MRKICALGILPYIISVYMVCVDRHWKESSSDMFYGPALPVQYHSGLWKFCQSSAAGTMALRVSGYCQSYGIGIGECHSISNNLIEELSQVNLKKRRRV